MIAMGIGDVTEPLPQASVEAMHRAIDDQSRRETFHGYGPEQGYESAAMIVKNDFASRGCDIAADEISSAMARSATADKHPGHPGARQHDRHNDPVYPVYVATNVIRSGTPAPADERGIQGLLLPPLCATARENHFTPENPETKSGCGLSLLIPTTPQGAVSHTSEAHEIGQLRGAEKARSFFMMRPTRRISPIGRFHIRSMRFPAAAMWPSNSAASAKPPLPGTGLAHLT